MEINGSYSSSHLQQPKAYSYSSGTPKTERKVLEKNRRDQMKALHLQLSSLLPHDYISKDRDGRQLPEQIDEAANYIRSLQTKLEKLKNKKDKLQISKKRPHGSMLNENWPSTSSSKKSSRVEIDEMGPDLDIILVIGLDNHSMFYDSIRLLDEQAGEVVHANFSIAGPAIFHIVHKKIASCEISKRLKELIDGSLPNQEHLDRLSCNPIYSDLQQLWDYEIQSDDIWNFANLAAFPSGIVGRCYMQ